MKITVAEYMASAVSPKQYPNPGHPECAFIGRSNVGKSSLINSLLNRKKLVKTSSTPGKTQTINFFNVNDQLIFADLPGYGFAKVPDRVKKNWQKMIERYLLERETLKMVVFIVDIRRKPSDLDLDMKHWLETSNIDYVLVATKSDKLSKTDRKKCLPKISEVLFKDNEGEIFAYSSKSNLGKKELWSKILERTSA